MVLAVLNALVAFALLAWLPQERMARSQAQGPRLGQWGSVARHFHNRQLVTTYAIGFCVLFTQVALFTYVTFHLAAPPYSLSTAALGWLFVVYLIGAVATPLAGRWVDVYGHRVGLGAAMAVGGAGSLLTLAPWLGAVIAGLALSASGVFIAQATTSAYIGAVTTEDRALAVGLYSTCYYAGGSVGAALPAALWYLGGWPACVALVLAVQSLGAAIALTQWANPERR
jgi:predicted MFS family arabinose efflux permease